MAQRGRRVLRKADPAPPQTRRVRLDRGTPSRHKPLLEGNQRCPKTLHLDRRPRQDHRRRATRAPNVRFDPLVSKLLREAGADSIGQKRIADGTRPNVWALRDAERWKNVEESVVAQFYRGPNAPVPTDHERKMLKEGIELALK